MRLAPFIYKIEVAWNTRLRNLIGLAGTKVVNRTKLVVLLLDLGKWSGGCCRQEHQMGESVLQRFLVCTVTQRLQTLYL